MIGGHFSPALGSAKEPPYPFCDRFITLVS